MRATTDIPVSDIYASVRTDGDVNGPEPFVRCFYNTALVYDAESRAIGLEGAELDKTLKRIDCDHFPLVTLWQVSSLVFDEGMCKPHLLPFQIDVGKEAKCIRIRECPVFAEVPYVVCTLFVILSPGGAIAPRVNSSFFSNLDIAGTSTALGKHFKDLAFGMIAAARLPLNPDVL